MGGYGVINRVIKTGLMIPYRLPHDLAISDVKATFLRIIFSTAVIGTRFADFRRSMSTYSSGGENRSI